MSKRSESKHKNALENQRKNYRQSGCGKYWVLDIAKRDGEKCEIKLLEHHLEICQKYCWYVNNYNYAMTNITIINSTTRAATSKFLLMHTLIAEPPSGKETDHRNHDKLDNRYDPNDKNKSNLQNKYRWQNMQNRLSTKGSTSKFIGVSNYTRDNNWRATINLPKHIYLGSYDTEEEAALSFNHAAILANELTAHLPEDQQNMFILNGANLELNTAMLFGMVENLSQDKLNMIYKKVKDNLL